MKEKYYIKINRVLKNNRIGNKYYTEFDNEG